ncbi:MAG: glycogen-debranching protein [Chlamydiia bacterium]|nr:glycogen-debranching protein [Chlamydiia bacterium]
MRIIAGLPNPLGFSLNGTHANFALFSRRCTRAFLGLAEGNAIQEIELLRTGDIWHIGIEGLPLDALYAFRLEGREQDPTPWLADPASKSPATPLQWGLGTRGVWSRCSVEPPFDWQGVERPQIPLSDLLIYEMHVRGFTRHHSSGVKHPGTYLGVIEKIPYLKKLGINAVELMPIFEFDETHCKNRDPDTQLPLLNYWGYNPLYFFSPMRRYSASEKALSEVKTLVREMHKNGIEVFLDVVYNHTGEGKESDYQFSFRGIDNASYYLLDQAGEYLDFTGCGNTLNVNDPEVSRLILESLCFWAQEVRIDGFRFDLASIFSRGASGEPIKNPPILEKIRSDPALRGVKLIAESWDAAGLYQLGHFPSTGPWSEWNGVFRDRTRSFLKGEGLAGKFADVLCGSEFLYRSQSPLCSINLITSHDGFSLYDLVSYNQKHNFLNGEMGKDGENHNFSWNCGVEGASDDPSILALREKQMRNFLLSLFLARGIPMLLMGDEYGQTRNGNNNPYVQDNAINWFLWDTLEQKQNMFDFVSGLIAFRKMCAVLKSAAFLTDKEVDWHGKEPFQADWGNDNRLIAYTLIGSPSLYIAFNAHGHAVTVRLPPGQWREVVRTNKSWSEHRFREPRTGELLGTSIELMPHSALVAIE